MMRYFLLLVGLWAGSLQAQESVELKFKPQGTANVFVQTTDNTTLSQLKVEDANGNVLLDRKTTTGKVTAFTETILQRDAAQLPVKIERVYKTCKLREGESLQDLLNEGGTVIITKEQDQYRPVLKDGTRVEGKLADMLARETELLHQSRAEKDRILFPKKVLRAGESWTIDMPAFLKMVSKEPSWAQLTFDIPLAKGTGRLMKTFMQDGRQVGEFQFEMTLPFTAMTMGNPPKLQEFDKGASLVLTTAMTACIDGTIDARSLNATMTLEGRTTVGQARAWVHTASTLKSSEVESSPR